MPCLSAPPLVCCCLSVLSTSIPASVVYENEVSPASVSTGTLSRLYRPPFSITMPHRGSFPLRPAAVGPGGLPGHRLLQHRHEAGGPGGGSADRGGRGAIHSDAIADIVVGGRRGGGIGSGSAAHTPPATAHCRPAAAGGCVPHVHVRTAGCILQVCVLYGMHVLQGVYCRVYTAGLDADEVDSLQLDRRVPILPKIVPAKIVDCLV